MSQRRPPPASAVAPWPYAGLDAPAAARLGWRPTPFRDFVVKVHQRCNLACDYCYVYELQDRSWRDRPAVMPPAVVRAVAAAIGEHARAHDLPGIRVTLHGGEPLLAGADRLLALVDEVRAAVPPGCEAEFGVQTNGVLLTAGVLDRLVEGRIRVGVSLDGPPAANDRHRRRADGRGSHADVARALALLGSGRARGAFAGILCTADPATDPLACYEELVSYAPPAIDFLLPHANWSYPPARSGHAEWLIAIFDRWYAAPRRETDVRLFSDIIAMICGGSGRTEQAGLSPCGVVVLESDGAIEQVDALKSAYPGAAATGLNVLADPLDAALRHPGVIARQLGAAALSEQCRGCAVHRVCGAGHYAHRFRAGDGFCNPTVYCADMFRLITHIQARVLADLTTAAPGAASASCTVPHPPKL
ncbi:FxsB family cyclophane-forming radical SAM/SPASM peptide maturase [Dactylosporangium sp. CA-233914]|uniref:FxsB family cyclophane-forming radical SAM/SPASM peptide maturase n=1 Tax=Dactylosporangium sp. CA-233914 TaxID=3239934 RepID=UPI003D913C43